MNALTLVTLGLLLTSSFAGCLYRADPPAAGDAVTTAPTPAAGSGPASAPASATAPGVRAVAVSGTIMSPGGGPDDNVACYPTDPGVCETYVHERVFSSGTMKGTWIDAGHYHYDATGTLIASGRQTFYGSIDGCGSGSFSATYAAGNDAVPVAGPDGQAVHGWDNLTLVPGSTSTGLANLVDVRVVMDYVISPATYAAHGTVKGRVWCTEPVATPSHEGAREVPLVGKFTSDGVQSHSTGACDDQGRCTDYSEMFLDATGGFAGRIQDIFSITPTSANPGSVDALGLRIFTGSFGECGSGTLAMGLHDLAAPKPNPGPSTVFGFREPTMKLVQGSQSTGLAGLLDLTVTLDFNATPTIAIDDGTVVGTMWCRNSTTLPTSHTGAREIIINEPLTSPGFQYTDTQRCDVAQPGYCEIYATQLLDLKGTMTGTVVDMAHIWPNADGSMSGEAWRSFTGSIAGCGSGSLSFHVVGTFARPEPVLTKPGYYHLHEPPTALVAGSTTTGFAQIVDVNITADWDGYGGATIREGDGTFKGSAWCAGAEIATAAPPTPSEAPRGSPVAASVSTLTTPIFG